MSVGNSAYSSILEIQPPPDYWNTDFLAESSFAVPINNGTTLVEFDLNDLPEAEAVLDLLLRERTPMRLWNIIALHYLARDREDVFLAILEKWLSEKQAGRLSEAVIASSKDDEAFCLDLLANYYALKFNDERVDRDRKKDYFTKAQRLYTQVERLSVYSQYHLVGRAYFCMFDTEKIDQAATQFEFVLTHAPADYLALQGRGIVAFQKGDFKKALQCFKRVLQHHPGCSADIRMAIGHCLFKLGRPDKAKLAYERALQLDTQSVGSMVGMALILVNEGTRASVEMARAYIREVYRLNKVHPINLNLLAEQFFYHKEPGKAIDCSAVAIQTCQSELLKAESAYMLGRSHHYMGEYDQAFQYYYQATQFAKQTFVLPWYGLGQMYIQRGEYPNAIQCFEKVLLGAPNNVETLKLLGLLYLHSAPKDKYTTAKAYLKKAIELNPDDIDAHIKYAELQEVSDRRVAKESYMRVVEIYKKDYDNGVTTRNECPAEILNNISVLCFHLEEYKEARKFLEWAKSRANEERVHNEVHYGSMLVTMAYNEGRINEAEYKMDEAADIYDKILHSHALYSDCYLRQGCMARDGGHILKASDWFKEASVRDPNNPDSHLLLGNLHMSKNEYGPAQKKFEKILNNPRTRKDTYSLLSLANIWLESLYTPGDQEKRRRHSERAFQMYREVLKIDPTNVYAVNGLGAILAKTGQLEEAREMFSVVRESTAEIMDCWLNVGHSYCDQKHYQAGIKMYENAIKRFKEAALDAQVYLYLARAHYFNGDMAIARSTLQHARRLVPHHQVLRYNLAVVMKRTAVNTLKDFQSTLSEVEGAITDLKSAQMIFDALAEEGDKHLLDPSRAKKESKACSDYYNQSTYHVHRAKQADEDQARQKLQIEDARKQFEERMAAERQDKLNQQLKMQEENLKKRQEVLERTAAVKERIIKVEAGEVEKPIRKRPRKERPLADGFIDDGQGPAGMDDEMGYRRRRHDPERRRRRRRERAARTGEDGAPLPPSSSEDEDEAPHLTRKDLYDGKGRRYKTKAYVSDTDSSSTSSDSDEEEKPGGKKSKKKGQSGGEESDTGITAEAGQAALASSDEEENSPKKRTKISKHLADSDDEEDEESPKKVAGDGEDETPVEDDGIKSPLHELDDEDGQNVASLSATRKAVIQDSDSD